MQQLQRPTTERVLLADLHVELRSLSFLGNWQADQFVYNWHPNFERSNYRENVRIIMEFLQYCIMNKSYKTCRYYWLAACGLSARLTEALVTQTSIPTRSLASAAAADLSRSPDVRGEMGRMGGRRQRQTAYQLNDR